MTSIRRHPGLVREHFTYKGRPKVRYDTEEQARTEAKRWKGKHAYRCSLCDGWHLGADR